ncbi:MAG: hypothetical protein V1779_06335 [bacterium]
MKQIMNNNFKKELQIALKILQKNIDKEISKVIKNKNLKKTETLIFKYIIKEFEYEYKKPIIKNSNYGFYLKEDNDKFRFKINDQELWKSVEFKTVYDLLLKNENNKLTDMVKIEKHFIVRNFISDYINIKTNNYIIDKNERINLISSYIKKILNQSIKHYIKLELKGIEVDNIHKFSIDKKSHFSFRRVTKQDLEVECDAYAFINGTAKPYIITEYCHWAVPTTIFEILMFTNKRDNLISETLKSISILRLFKTAGVIVISNVESSELNSKSTINYRLLSKNREFISTLGDYKVDIFNRNEFIKFWKKLVQILPESIYDDNNYKNEPLSIAYRAYLDALLQNSSVEKRITDAVMGLESLYLNGQGELKFRLSNYVSLVFSHLGFDSKRASQIINLGYDLRSSYVHGNSNIVNYTKKIKKLGLSIMEFQLIIYDFLRLSIIIVLLLEIEKDDFLNLIDLALIDKNSNIELRRKISSISSYLHFTVLSVVTPDSKTS